MSSYQFTAIRRVLIANRGEIACRIIRTCKELGLVSIAIYTPADRTSAHVRLADEAWLLPGPDQSAYIEEEAVLERVAAAGVTWAGPSAEVIRQFGLKHTARELAVKSGVGIASIQLIQGPGNTRDRPALFRR
jgi:urea carboxylase